MYATQEFYINMGPQHPSTHGVLRLMLKLDGEVVVEATPHIGYLHRAIEKMAENLTYHQFIPITDRFDYVTSMSSNCVYVSAVEKLMGITVPLRADYIRVIMLELNRIASHLVWFGSMGLDLGATTPFLYAFREREKIMDLFEMACGARLTYNYFRIGGVSYDISDEFIKKALEFCKIFPKRIKEYEDLLTYNVIFLARTKDKGILDVKTAIDFGVTGPSLRAAGFKWDLRKEEPYSCYCNFEFDTPTGTKGDIWDRYKVRVEELKQSTQILEQVLNNLPKGKHKITVPLKITPPPGEVYFRMESPRGDIGCYIVSKGEEKPYRLKLRGASFSNLSVIPKLLEGVKIPDIVAILASLDIILPETDR